MTATASSMPLQRVENKFLVSRLGADSVLMNTDSGDYLGLNEVGTRIWDLLSAPQSIDELVAALLNEYNVTDEQCKAEVNSFISRMQEKGMLQ
jgi:hypothetical protein